MSRVMLCVLHVVQVQLLQHMNICVLGTKDSKAGTQIPTEGCFLPAHSI